MPVVRFTEPLSVLQCLMVTAINYFFSMKKVAIYTTPTCTYCKATKDFFNQHSVKYEEYNVATDLERRREMIDKSGQMGVPVITVDNDVVIGYDPAGLAKLLEL